MSYQEYYFAVLLFDTALTFHQQLKITAKNDDLCLVLCVMPTTQCVYLRCV